MKTVENAAAVELRCLLISAQSVNISQVSIRIPTTVKNAEYVGKEHDQFYCAADISHRHVCEAHLLSFCELPKKRYFIPINSYPDI